MQNAGELLSDAWVAQMDQEAKDYKTWDKARQKKWSQDYLALSLRAFGMALDNAKETLSRINAVRDAVKLAIDGADKIVAAKRKKNDPLSDAERAWLAKAKAAVDGSAAKVESLTKAYTDNSPFAGRLDYYRTAVAEGALGSDVPAKIMAARKQSIDVGNEFGKAGPVVLRLAEYRKRWEVLAKEIDGLARQRSGKVQDWAVAINQQIKDFEAGNEKWLFDFETVLGNVARNIEGAVGKLDAKNPKGFGASLVKAVKLKVSAKAKDKASGDTKALQTFLKAGADKLKIAKGSLKTRFVELQSLNAQLKDVGPAAEPQRKLLAGIGKKLDEHQQTIDALVTQLDEAVAAARK